MIVAIKGGLGNQMFQSAFALMLKKRTGCEVKVDGRDFPNKGREFMLDRIGLELRRATEKEIFADRWGSSFPVAKARHWFRKLTGVGKFEPGIYQEAERWKVDPNAFLQKTSTYFNGYWMSYRYYDEGFPSGWDFPFLHADWPERFQEIVGLISDTESVGVHIRRGDYANVDSVRATYLVCSPTYFERAMKCCVGQLNCPHFYLFSDDEEYVRSLDWGDMAVTVVPSAPGVGDEYHLRLLSSCRHQIISNSTFSWWAAYLNPNPEKRVYCPDRWQTSVCSKDLVGDFIPPQWQLVQTAN